MNTSAAVGGPIAAADSSYSEPDSSMNDEDTSILGIVRNNSSSSTNSSKLRTKNCNLDTLLLGADEEDEEEINEVKMTKPDYKLDIKVDLSLVHGDDEDVDENVMKPAAATGTFGREMYLLLSSPNATGRMFNATENDASDFESEIERRCDNEVAALDRRTGQQLADLNEEKEVGN